MPGRQTLVDLIDGLAADGERTAVRGQAQGEPVAWSRGELHTRVARLAAGLIADGLVPGEPVALVAPPEPAWIACLLAVVRAGGIAMPLADGLGDDELLRLLDHAGCRRLFLAEARLGELAARLGDRHVWRLGLRKGGGGRHPAWSDLEREGGGLPPAPDPDRPACLLYTSGTTGTPKGVLLSHANLMANVEAIATAGLAGPEDRVLLPLPLHHTYPLSVGVLGSLAVGATLLLPEGLTGPQIARAAADGRATVLIGVPRLHVALVEGIRAQVRARGRLAERLFRLLLALSIALRQRLGIRIGRYLFGALHRRLGGSLRLLGSGGSRLDPEVAGTLEGLGFEVVSGYGLTETAPILTFNRPGRARLDSVGLPVPGVELRIADQEGDQGEIQARGPNVFEGYRDNPEATREAFTPDGWFRTGDLGRIDPDGHLLITGRAKELIVLSGGKNVFPEDVEAVFKDDPTFEEVAVIEREGSLVGLVRPNAEHIRAQGAGRAAAILREAIEACSLRLPRHERLSGFALVQEPLPRTQLGKLQRHLLPEIYERARAAARPAATAAEPSEADRALMAAEPAAAVLAWLRERLEVPGLGLDTSPTLDLGLDSFAWMSLGLELEERFGLDLDEEHLAGAMTVRDLLREVQAAEARGPAERAGRKAITPEQARWLEPQRPWHVALSLLLWCFAWLLMRGVFRLRVRGREHLPESGGVLIAPNHASYLDPFAIAAALSWPRLRRIYWAGWTGIVFTGPLTRLFSRTVQIVPVDPDRGVGASLALGREVLERRRDLIWFPEGRRTLEGDLLPFLTGVGALVREARATVVPVWIEGSFQALPSGRSLPRLARIEVVFGEPVPAAELVAEGGGDPARIAAAIRSRVAALAPAEGV